MPDDEPLLSISDVARLTGLQVTQLRAWEARHGFPTPARLDNGHRRYGRATVETIRHVVHLRSAGLTLDAAIQQATGGPDRMADSVFSELRRARPDLSVARLSVRAMLAISQAIEDGCAAAADRGVVIGAFQSEAVYRRVEPRWRELARTAGVAIAFADFRGPRHGDPVEVPLSERAVLRREWLVACAGPQLSAVLAGWEYPDATPGGQERSFEAAWSVERSVANHACRLGVDLAERLVPDLELPPVAPAIDAEDSDATLWRVTSLCNRIVENMDAAS